MENICANITESEKTEVNHGLISPDVLSKICDEVEQDEEKIRDLLCHFELAAPLKDGELFIPSIVSGLDEVFS